MKEQKNSYKTGKKKKHILFLLPFAFCILTMLGGCVNYDVGVNFDSQTHGEIVQHIKLGERLTSFSSETVREWLDSIDRRVRSLQGRTKRLSDSEVTVRIPFNNGDELEEKFNQFYNPVEDQNNNDRVANSLETDLPKFGCHIKVDQNNFVLFLRNRLTLELDLRSLSLLSSSGNVLVSPGQLLGLEFSLRTPWGAKSIEAAANGITPSIEAGNQLTWKLKPGEINYLEAIFWLPSPVGIGTVIIALLVLAGSYLKYQLLPAIGIGKRQPASEVKV